MIYKAVMDLDGQGKPLYSLLPFRAEKNMVFAGATVNDPGDYTGGTGNPATLFTVTGNVQAYLLGICSVSLVGAATLEAGLVGNTAILLAQIADTTTFDVNMAWVDSTPALGEGSTPKIHPIGGGLDIIQTVGTANITAGELDYYCFWRPLSSDGLIVAA